MLLFLFVVVAVGIQDTNEITRSKTVGDVSSSNPHHRQPQQQQQQQQQQQTYHHIPQEQKQEQRSLASVSDYNVHFEQCQHVTKYDDEARKEGFSQLVVFRLCRVGHGDDDHCKYDFGEYVLDLEEYLEITVSHFRQEQEQMCATCQECGNYDNMDGEQNNQNYYNVDCSSCYDECMKIENMEDNGYIDATEFLECQMIYDPEDDGVDALYAGPMCAGNGARVKIGVFIDEECNMLDSSKDVDDYLIDNDGYQMKLSHALLRNSYHNADSSTLNCTNSKGQAVDTCDQLYSLSAKCESPHGMCLTSLDHLHNQQEEELVVCDFIDSIKKDSYNQEGSVVLQSGNARMPHYDDRNRSNMTDGQKYGLLFSGLACFGMAIYVVRLRTKLKRLTSTAITGDYHQVQMSDLDLSDN